jgi:uncharacterized protein
MLILFLFLLIYMYLELQYPELTRQEMVIENLPDELDGLRILHISDLHAKKPVPRLNRAQKLIAGVDADLAVITGDFKHTFRTPDQKPLPALKRIIDAIHSRLGTYGIIGNKEDTDLVPHLENLGVAMFENGTKKIIINNAPFWIIGVSNAQYYRKMPPIEQTLQHVEGEGFRLLLAHSPDILAKLTNQKIDLVLAGDTHGGQIHLPFIGPMKIKSKISGHYVRGTIFQGNTIMFISRGLGWSGLPVRLLCRPEISVIVLRKK